MMRVGFNYPTSYNRFGSDFGPNIWVPEDVWNRQNALEAAGKVAEIPLPPLFDHVDRNLDALKKMGISVVRWFLLGNGNSYGPAPTRRHRLADYEFNPPSRVDRRFRRDLEELLTRFKKHGLQLIPSLISFEFGSSKVAGTGPQTGIGWGGRADVITDPARRKVFLDTMLGELLAASAPFKEQICAWEVINEPVWLYQGAGPLSKPAWVPRIPEVKRDVMNAFLEDALGRIERAGFRSTVGHRYFSDLTQMKTGNMPQFHYYNGYATPGQFLPGMRSDPKQIRGQKLFNGTPKPFLGEFDSRSDRFGEPWTDDLPNSDSTLERLRLLEREGCELAMIWPELGGAKDGQAEKTTLAAEIKEVTTNDVIKLLPETCRSIAAYTGGVAPPARSPGN